MEKPRVNTVHSAHGGSTGGEDEGGGEEADPGARGSNASLRRSAPRNALARFGSEAAHRSSPRSAARSEARPRGSTDVNLRSSSRFWGTDACRAGLCSHRAQF